MNDYVINVCFTYNTYLLMTFWLLLHKKNNISSLWGTWCIIMLGQIAASLLSLCMTKWLRKWRRGWRYVRSNTKNAKSLLTIFSRHDLSVVFPNDSKTKKLREILENKRTVGVTSKYPQYGGWVRCCYDYIVEAWLKITRCTAIYA